MSRITREVPAAHLGRTAGYLNKGVHGFPQSFHANAETALKQATTAPSKFLPTHFS